MGVVPCANHFRFVSWPRSFLLGPAAAQRSNQEMQVKKLKVNDVELAHVEEGKGGCRLRARLAGDRRSWDSLRRFISEKGPQRFSEPPLSRSERRDQRCPERVRRRLRNKPRSVGGHVPTWRFVSCVSQ
jgi:hypothetical protein